MFPSSPSLLLLLFFGWASPSLSLFLYLSLSVQKNQKTFTSSPSLLSLFLFFLSNYHYLLSLSLLLFSHQTVHLYPHSPPPGFFCSTFTSTAQHLLFSFAHSFAQLATSYCWYPNTREPLFRCKQTSRGFNRDDGQGVVCVCVLVSLIDAWTAQHWYESSPNRTKKM